MSSIIATSTYRPIFASGLHAPLEIALPIVAAIIIVRVDWSVSRGRSVLGGDVTVQCSKGHTFQTTWSPLGSFTAIRLGTSRYQRCPVGNHWAMVKRVSEANLADQQRPA
jgi:hypothetical protein